MADRDPQPGSPHASGSRARLGTFFVAFAFGVSLAAGVGFLVAYWRGGGTQALGGTLALCAGGMGVALVLHAHWLMDQREATEPRQPLPSPAGESDKTREAFSIAAGEIQRRHLLTWMAAATGGLATAIVISLMRSLIGAPPSSLFDLVWTRGQRLMSADGRPIPTTALEAGSTMIVFPEDHIGVARAQTVLIRVDPGLLRLPAERANWAPMGYVAYSRVCTHAGCPVGLFEETANLLLCPCHQSTFDVLHAAQPTGGPAARPLPQVPLYVDGDGHLRAGAGFTEPPGPGFWWMS